MVVMKFGGTSVGSADSIQQVKNIVTSTQDKKIVVLSAFSKVTNLLVEINQNYEQNSDALAQSIQALHSRCLEVITPLYSSEEYLQKATEFVASKIDEITSLSQQEFTVGVTKQIIAQGELISTQVMQFYMEENNVDSTLVPALDFMVITEGNEPNLEQIAKNLETILSNHPQNIIITQGFICRDHKGNVSNLERGGSDYTASLIGAAVNSSIIEIWTDIDGMHNNDPRYVENTFSLEEISFDEAAELAYFGAKILHPQSLIPAKKNDIPVLLKNTFNPKQKGTIIRNETVKKGVTSIAAKDGITAIKIKSYRMLLAYGFLKKVFEVFETYQTPIDMITTSEVAVSLTIDNNTHLEEIVNELQEFGAVEVDTDLSIVCVAGDFSQENQGISAKVFDAITHIPIRMISYGGSSYNISLLVKTTDKTDTLQSLNKHLF